MSIKRAAIASLLFCFLQGSRVVASVVCDCDKSVHADGFFCEPYCLHKNGNSKHQDKAPDVTNAMLENLKAQTVQLLIQQANKTRSKAEIARELALLELQRRQVQQALREQEQRILAAGSPAQAKILKDLDKLDEDLDDEDTDKKPLLPVPKPRLSPVPTYTVKGVNIQQVRENPSKDHIWASNPNDFSIDVDVYLSDFSTCNCTHVFHAVTIPPHGNVEVGWVANMANNDPWPYHVRTNVSKHGKGHFKYGP